MKKAWVYLYVRDGKVSVFVSKDHDADLSLVGSFDVKDELALGKVVIREMILLSNEGYYCQLTTHSLNPHE